MPYFWLSFCDEDKPAGEHFLGVAILQAHDVIEAVSTAHRLKINPGGQVASWELPVDYELPEQFKERLLSKSDIETLQGSAETLADL